MPVEDRPRRPWVQLHDSADSTDEEAVAWAPVLSRGMVLDKDIGPGVFQCKRVQTHLSMLDLGNADEEGPLDKILHQDQVSYPIPPNLTLTHTLTATLIHISKIGRAHV